MKTLKVMLIKIDTLNYEINRPLPIGKRKEVFGLMKHKLCGKIITKFIGFKLKTYSYLTDNSNSDS